MTALLVATIVFLLLANALDIDYTEQGLKKGVALEGNSWLIGEKPSLKALVLRDYAFDGLICLAMIEAYVRDNYIWCAFAGVAAAKGAKHVIGAMKWRRILK